MTLHVSRWLTLNLLESGRQEFFCKREGKPLKKVGSMFQLVLESSYCTIREKRQWKSSFLKKKFNIIWVTSFILLIVIKKWLNLLLCDSCSAHRSVLRWHINQDLNTTWLVDSACHWKGTNLMHNEQSILSKYCLLKQYLFILMLTYPWQTFIVLLLCCS